MNERARSICAQLGGEIPALAKVLFEQPYVFPSGRENAAAVRAHERFSELFYAEMDDDRISLFWALAVIWSARPWHGVHRNRLF